MQNQMCPGKLQSTPGRPNHIINPRTSFPSFPSPEHKHPPEPAPACLPFSSPLLTVCMSEPSSDADEGHVQGTWERVRWPVPRPVCSCSICSVNRIVTWTSLFSVCLCVYLSKCVCVCVFFCVCVCMSVFYPPVCLLCVR